MPNVTQAFARLMITEHYANFTVNAGGKSFILWILVHMKFSEAGS